MDDLRPFGCGIFMLLGVAFVGTFIALGSENTTPGMIILFVVAPLLGFITYRSEKKALNKNIQRENARNHANMQMSVGVRSRAQSQGFVFDKYEETGKYILAMDTIHKKWLVSNGSEFNIYSYSDLVSYELNENGKTIASGTADGAIIGGMLFGTAGAIIGASGPQRIDKKCDSISINITVKNANIHKIFVLDDNYFLHRQYSSLDVNSLEFKPFENKAKDLIAILDVISKENEIESNKPVQTSTDIELAQTEIIKKYKELLDMGAITQEEFENKKKKALEK